MTDENREETHITFATTTTMTDENREETNQTEAVATHTAAASIPPASIPPYVVEALNGSEESCSFFVWVLVCLLLATILTMGVTLGLRLRSLEACFVEPEETNPSDLIAFWYKPHYQCGSSAGTTAQQSADFINAQMMNNNNNNNEGGESNYYQADFVGISEWSPYVNVSALGNAQYGSVAAVCGYGNTDYTTSAILFHNTDRWERVASYPSSNKCHDFVPLPPWASSPNNASIGSVCLETTVPGENDCCSCVYSEEEYDQADSWGQNLGQRPWTAGIFEGKKDQEGASLCVVTGEFPHPLWNYTLPNLYGKPIEKTSNSNNSIWQVSLNDDDDDATTTTTTSTVQFPQEPFAIQQYVCTTQLQTEQCILSPSKDSILFGSDVFVQGITDFCGNVPILVMTDTNVGMGDFASDRLFNVPPLNQLESIADKETTDPYTCCNDTVWGGGLNRYASDRIMVVGNAETGQDITIDRLEGGSVGPGGRLPDDLGYQCHANEEHAPLRAHISLN